jgi:hypothetical protein
MAQSGTMATPRCGEQSLVNKKGNASFSDDIRPATAKNNELGEINNKHPITKDHLLQKAALIHAAEREMCLWAISVLFW